MIIIAAKSLYAMRKNVYQAFIDRRDHLYYVIACVGVGVQQQYPSLYFQGCWSTSIKQGEGNACDFIKHDQRERFWNAIFKCETNAYILGTKLQYWIFERK